MEDNIPYAKKITPLIRKHEAPAIKEYAIPELTKVFKGKEGSGLD